MSIANAFTRFAKWTSRTSGHPGTFGLAVGVILVWAITGPFFHFSDTWQLIINTGTTVVTFLMVFLIQNTQNRDATAMQIKLDELIRAMKGAHNELVNLEELSDEELEKVKARFTHLAEQARDKLQQRPQKKESRKNDQAETGNSRGLGKAATKASTASGSS
ncbi:MAG TPA: low affinity iron permease family protein [Gemmatimonadales bacterium]|jgi:low affinity Fe/Cu permease|nr:low affinity iron permease family protein [Gemmatimonadales bacterium]